MIVCDECEARTRQPIPADWLVVWLPEIRSWGHLCPEHRTDSGLMRPVLPPVPEAPVLASRAPRVDEPLFATSPVQPRGSDAPASAVDEPVGRARRDAGAIRPPTDLAQGGKSRSEAEFVLTPRPADDLAESFAKTLEAAFRDELGLPKAEVDDAPASRPKVVHSKEPVILHFTGRMDDADESRPKRSPPHRAPRLIEPAPFVDVYDRPPLPRSLRELAEDGWRVSGWGAA